MREVFRKTSSLDAVLDGGYALIPSTGYPNSRPGVMLVLRARKANAE